jgi:cytochrome c553
MKLAPILLVLCAALSQYAMAEKPSQPRAPGVESKNYQWDKHDKELSQLLKTKGDVERGQVAYEVCRGCHKSNAEGRPDAGYPQLAGQHVSVLVKQMADVRRGRRDNPRMHPFIEAESVPLSEIPDIAAYLHSLPVPTNNRKGEGSNLALGKTLYDKDCASCHGDAGEGDADKLYPKVASQHYPYLFRESIDIRDWMRRNSNPKMVKVLKTYSDEDIAAVSDYMARMPPINDSQAMVKKP